MAQQLKAYTSALPIETKQVTLLDLTEDTFACTLEDKIAMLRRATDVVAVWEGRYENHAFKVDPSKALTDIIRRALPSAR